MLKVVMLTNIMLCDAPYRTNVNLVSKTCPQMLNQGES
jgi:hypothetical protein